MGKYPEFKAWLINDNVLANVIKPDSLNVSVDGSNLNINPNDAIIVPMTPFRDKKNKPIYVNDFIKVNDYIFLVSDLDYLFKTGKFAYRFDDSSIHYFIPNPKKIKQDCLVICNYYENDQLMEYVKKGIKYFK